MEDGEEEEEENNEDDVKLDWESDYEFAHLMRTHIIPTAVLWYTGEATMDGYEYEDDDDEEDEDDAAEDNEEDEEDDEPAPVAVPTKSVRQGPKKGSGRGNGPTAPTTTSPFTPSGTAGQPAKDPECKQS
jgi:nucleosome assembly protein 1-like 1